MKKASLNKISEPAFYLVEGQEEGKNGGSGLNQLW
jgi:hypothetical protein